MSPRQSDLHNIPTARENKYVGNKTSAVGRNSSEWKQPHHDNTCMPGSNRRESMFYSPRTPRTYSENNYMTLSNNSRKRGPPMNKCDSDYDLPFKYPYEHEQGSRRFSHNIQESRRSSWKSEYTPHTSVMRKPQENQTSTGRLKLSKQRSKPKGKIFRENLPVIQNNSGADLTFNFNYQSEDINKGVHFSYKDTSITSLWDAACQ